jgi:hypothetical protein
MTMLDFLQSVTLQKLVDEQHAKGIEIEGKPATKRAISSAPVVTIRVAGRHPLRRQAELPGRRWPVHDARPVDRAE